MMHLKKEEKEREIKGYELLAHRNGNSLVIKQWFQNNQIPF